MRLGAPDFSEDGRKTLIRASFLASVLLIVFGSWVSWSREYAAGLLAGMGANGLAVGVGLLLLDNFQRARRRQEWERITHGVLQEAKNQLLNIGFEVAIAFGLQKGKAQATLLPKWGSQDTVPEGLELLVSEIDEMYRALAASTAGRDLLTSQARAFHARSRERCEAVGLLLRDIDQAEVDSDLVAAFVAFGRAVRSASLHIDAMQIKGLPTFADMFIPRVQGIVTAGASLYRTILAQTTPSGETAVFGR